MKKLLFVFGVVGLLAISSCNRERTCICTDSYDSSEKDTIVTDDDCDDLMYDKILGMKVSNGNYSTCREQ